MSTWGGTSEGAAKTSVGFLVREGGHKSNGHGFEIRRSEGEGRLLSVRVEARVYQVHERGRLLLLLQDFARSIDKGRECGEVTRGVGRSSGALVERGFARLRFIALREQRFLLIIVIKRFRVFGALGERGDTGKELVLSGNDGRRQGNGRA